MIFQPLNHKENGVRRQTMNRTNDRTMAALHMISNDCSQCSRYFTTKQEGLRRQVKPPETTNLYLL